MFVRRPVESLIAVIGMVVRRPVHVPRRVPATIGQRGMLVCPRDHGSMEHERRHGREHQAGDETTKVRPGAEHGRAPGMPARTRQVLSVTRFD